MIRGKLESTLDAKLLPKSTLKLVLESFYSAEMEEKRKIKTAFDQTYWKDLWCSRYYTARKVEAQEFIKIAFLDSRSTSLVT